MVLILHVTAIYLCRLSAIATDVVVLIVTWCKAYRIWREMEKTRLTSSFSACFLRDGELLLRLSVVIYMTEIQQALLILCAFDSHSGKNCPYR